jgi:hypothetical protein
MFDCSEEVQRSGKLPACVTGIFDGMGNIFFLQLRRLIAV